MRLAFKSNRFAWHPKRKHRPRCGAKTRAGGSCLVRVERGKARCRFHGGLSTGNEIARWSEVARVAGVKS
jgi:hypothetical protein